MTTFQLFLLLLAGGVFYLFFKQLFSGNYPKRGVDFEGKVADEQIGTINRPEQTFSTPKQPLNRVTQLLSIADEAVANNDLEEAKKALGSALIIEPKNPEVLQKMGYVLMQMEQYQEAKGYFETVVSLDENDDMAHGALANVLNKLGKQKEAQEHHKKALALDSTYPAHHFNYANTLYDLGRHSEALVAYQKALELDPSLEVAKQMITQLGGEHGAK